MESALTFKLLFFGEGFGPFLRGLGRTIFLATTSILLRLELHALFSLRERRVDKPHVGPHFGQSVTSPVPQLSNAPPPHTHTDFRTLLSLDYGLLATTNISLIVESSPFVQK